MMNQTPLAERPHIPGGAAWHWANRPRLNPQPQPRMYKGTAWGARKLSEKIAATFFQRWRTKNAQGLQSLGVRVTWELPLLQGYLPAYLPSSRPSFFIFL